MDETWTIGSSAEWEEATAAIDATLEGERGLILQRAGEGQWTSTWQSWQAPVRSLKMTVEAEIDLFDDKKIQVVISGAETP